MSALAVGALLGGILGQAPRPKKRSGAPHRTGAPVRRDSMEAGTFEDGFFVAPAPGETDRQLAAARRALDAGRKLKREERQGRHLSKVERAVAALTAGAVRVMEAICEIARVQCGRVFPSYDALATATELGRGTVGRGLALLEAAGFIIRQRRFKRVDQECGEKRYQQTSNAYRPMLPQSVLRFLPRWMKPAPIPVDEQQRINDAEEDVQRMYNTLTAKELARATNSGSLGAGLARLTARWIGGGDRGIVWDGAKGRTEAVGRRLSTVLPTSRRRAHPPRSRFLLVRGGRF